MHSNSLFGSAAAGMQFGFASLTAVAALAVGCAAIGAVAFGAFADAFRISLARRAISWLAIIAGVFALTWVTTGIDGRELDAYPWMIALGVIGIVINAATVLAVFPLRVREFGVSCARATSWSYLVLIASGVLGLAYPGMISHAQVVSFVVGVYVLRQVLDRRERT